MAPPSRRRILPPETLAAFGAAPLFPPTTAAADGSVSAAAQAPPTRNVARAPLAGTSALDGASATSDEAQPTGIIEIAGWRITTRNSSIGDERGMDELTSLLEDFANTSDGIRPDQRKRRLCPPEITFLDAIISLQCESPKPRDETAEKNGESTTEMRFTARDALVEWAEAHRHLDMHEDHSQQSAIHRDECQFRGVSILKTADAKVWSEKPQNVDAAAAASGSSEFYYDWTFSSPYAGTVLSTRNNVTGGDINGRSRWKPLQQSHIPFHMLQDTTQQILLYDDIHLYEDDLHDNGDVSLNIKVRAMPRCWYVLQRLFVRVDRVCVRCREARYFCLFDDSDISENGVRVNAIYRDVAWRESSWDALAGLGLPVDPAAWREESAGGGASAGVPTPPLASLLARLPDVPLPDDLPRFSYFDAKE